MEDVDELSMIPSTQNSHREFSISPDSDRQVRHVKRKFDAADHDNAASAMEGPQPSNKPVSTAREAASPRRGSKRTRPTSKEDPEVTDSFFEDADFEGFASDNSQKSLQQQTSDSPLQRHEEPILHIKGRASKSILPPNLMSHNHQNRHGSSNFEIAIPPRAMNESEAEHHAPPSWQSGGAGFMGKFSRYFGRSPSSRDESKPETHRAQNGVGNRTEERSAAQPRQHRMAQEEQNTHINLNENELKWKEDIDRLKEENNRLTHTLEFNQGQSKERIQELNHKLQESESARRRIQNEHDNFIREQQEASFKRMESARWLPKQESEVMADLKRLKTNMRKWAKATSIKELSPLNALQAEDQALLVQALSKVLQLDDSQFPQVLTSATRAPMLLLNALLAHDVYTSFFGSPFFFDDKDSGKDSELARVYERAMKGNQEDAHMWRSQTLRLLMPPEQNNDSDAVKRIRSRTRSKIAKVANQKASSFLGGPAKHLIDPNSNSDLTKLLKIFTDTASMAYDLWTRRTGMEILTFGDINDWPFDSESPYFDPDTLVRYDDHEDGLRGRPITMAVHPILRAFGTDEGQDYKNGRVWTKGVVWLDSRIIMEPSEKLGEHTGEQTRTD